VVDLDEDIDKLWEEYSITKDIEIRDKLILNYATLLKYVAGKLSIHFGNNVEYDDLVSYGIFGLIDAIDKFDYKKGIKFETYASLRIRGSIIDGIRKLDWVPRSLRQKSKLIESANRELELTLGREATEEELAEKLEMTIEEVRDIHKKTALLSVISLDDFLDQNHEISFDTGGKKNFETPHSSYEAKETKKTLIEAIKNLSEKEQIVISLYYFEDLTLKEISKIMEVSESRVSQLHSKSLFKLQEKLGKDKAILFSK
jgi:RNA polymerase sigma factor FliA